MTKPKKTTAKAPRKPARSAARDVKLMGAAIINSHLEAVRVALVIYSMDWEDDGFAEHFDQQLRRVYAARKTSAMALERGRKQR